MPTYVYETLPATGREPQQFEVRQSIKDEPLTNHPETGEPVRRMITAGAGILSPGSSSPAPAPSRGGHCCGGGCACG